MFPSLVSENKTGSAAAVKPRSWKLQTLKWNLSQHIQTLDDVSI